MSIDIGPANATGSATSTAAAIDGRGEQALARMFAAEPFRRSGRLRTFLEFVVRASLAERPDLLKERAIAVEGLGLPPTFDPRIDPTVRVLAVRVRRALDRYYLGDGCEEAVRIELPKGAYRAVVTERPTPGGGAPDQAGRPLVVVASLVDHSPGEHPPHLAPGLSEALAAKLAAAPGYGVVGPVGTTSGELHPIGAIGRRVGATHLLQGSVRSADAVLRVSVRLSDAVTGQILWSEVYDDDAGTSGLFEIEDRIARRVVGTLADLRGVLYQPGRWERSSAQGALAYDAMLRYYAYLGNLDHEAVEDTTQALELALADQPGDPHLMAMLAGIMLFRGVGELGHGGPAASSPELIERAEQLARRSDALDPTNAHAATVLAFVELVLGHHDRCEAQLRRVLELGPPQPSLLFMVGVGLVMLGDWEGGVEVMREAMALNPNHPGWQHGFLALDALLRGEAALALAEAQRVETPGLVWGPLLRAAALAELGRGEEAAEQLERVVAALPADDGRRQDVFTSYMRLPDDIAAVLLAALAKIPPPADPPG